MNRITLILAMAALVLIPLKVSADEMDMHKHGASMSAEKSTTITGEVVDTGCYLGHAARGEKHVSCAIKCINNGMPMGLLTSDGKLYLITMNHDNADPYNKLKEMAGKTVAVTGVVMTRSGMKGIDVSEFKLAAASASR